MLIAAATLATSATSVRGSDDFWLEEIIVTARRAPEVAARVPLAIDVLGVDPRESARIDGLQAISAQAPGFGFEGQFGASGGIPMLRGQSQPTAAGDNVAVFVDGVYQANRDAIDVAMLDLERIELVRGPQSTLFGHSAFAGALNYVSHMPTREPSYGFSLEGGTDQWLGAEASASGPLAQSGWLGRVGALHRRAGGTLDDASSGRGFGDLERNAIAGSLARDADATDWTTVLAFRYGTSDASHPAVSRLAGQDYNCGSVGSDTGLWSYYCGRAPIARRYDLSDDLPDSTSRSGQLALRITVPLNAMRLESDTSYYDGHARIIRDGDASDAGQLFGVCALGRSCPVPGLPDAPVERLANVNEVIAWPTDVRETSQEFRVRGGDQRFGWLIGAVWFETRSVNGVEFGANRGDLGPDELYTAILPATPGIAGPPSMINLALTADPSSVQFEQFLDEYRRRTLAGYVALDFKPAPAFALRAEFRHSRERLSTRNVTAFFAPNPDPAPPSQDFVDNNPRLSVAYAPSESMFTWLSAARGSRSGGINNIPGLDASERSFAPEFNWTYEGGLRFAADGVVRSMAVTGYYIDWRDTQAGTWASTPGVIGWITSNTAGVITRGVEASLALQPTPWLRGEFDYSHVAARFRAGSDFPGLGPYCGLSPDSSESNFCTVGPPRTPLPNGPDVVPWVDGNELARVPATAWHGALLLDPSLKIAGWQLRLRADLSHQDDMFENQIEALHFGRRTLLDAQLSATRGPWTAQIWGRNLTDDRYIRSSFGTDPGLFPTMPSAIDFIYGDGRRIGITIRYAD